ncbi:hypothetical protein Tco_0520031 [Tanacetum coccineum]
MEDDELVKEEAIEAYAFRIMGILCGSGIQTIVYADSDHAMEITSKTLFLSPTTEAEYVSVGKACQQALCMKQALIDYDIRLEDIPIICDNKGAIDLSKNPVQHSRAKHIEIRHHFLRDNVQKRNISIERVLIGKATY